MDYSVLYDSTLVRYILGLIVNLCGACLFGWWWQKNKRASFVFMCVTLWFVGDLIEKVIQVYGRALRLITKSTAFSENSWLWIYKGDISFVVSILVVIYMTGRVLGYTDAKGKWFHRKQKEASMDEGK